MKLTFCWLALSVALLAGSAWLLQSPAETAPSPASPQGGDKSKPSGVSLQPRIPIFVVALLMDKDSHKELKLSTEQVAKATAVIKGEEAAMSNIREYTQTQDARAAAAMKAIDALLDKDQKKRLGQLKLQATGVKLLFEGNVADALKLTQEQQSKILAAKTKIEKALADEVAKDLKEGKKPAPFLKADSDRTRKVLEGVLKELTKEQTATITEMVGPIYQGVLPNFPGIIGLELTPAEMPNKK
jgi:hypothetical protein